MTSTRNQKFAQAAFQAISKHEPDGKPGDKRQKVYLSFAKSFPTLLHTCGLAQAVAFAAAKGKTQYLEDLVAALEPAVQETGIDLKSPDDLLRHTREQDVLTYLHLSRQATTAAVWLKRYAEARLTQDSSSPETT